jgi:radical S-adenosyl methionine domain-containing protein 2
MSTLPIDSVNFHLWQPCNMRCRFCFATFADVRREALPKGHLDRADALRLVSLLAEAGFAKINFAGGEPLLCPWLPELLRTAKTGGMVTSVVTNGSLLDRAALDQLREHLDWLALSVDSASATTLREVGRTFRGSPLPVAHYVDICDAVRAAAIRLKVNTVVTAVNWRESLAGFVVRVRPERWKIMQVLPVLGQNSSKVGPLLVTAGQFDAFVERHRWVSQVGVTLVPERNADMIGSYAMVDPAGRFYDNVDGAYSYSQPILSSGVRGAMSEVSMSREAFLARGGRYRWGPAAANAALGRAECRDGC